MKYSIKILWPSIKENIKCYNVLDMFGQSEKHNRRIFKYFENICMKRNSYLIDALKKFGLLNIHHSLKNSSSLKLSLW